VTTSPQWFLVTPDEWIAAEPERILAINPVEAAKKWAIARGHESDDRPVVKVTAPNGETSVYELHAVIEWRCCPVKQSTVKDAP